MAAADRVVSIITQVTLVNERSMDYKISHTRRVIFLDSVYSPIGVSELSVNETFYAQLQMVVDSYPKRYNLVILADFNSINDTDRGGFESCVDPHGSGSRDESSSMPPDFAKCRQMRIAEP